MVEEEISVLKNQWRDAVQDPDHKLLSEYLGPNIDKVDPFDIPQLANAIRTCKSSLTLSEAGRTLFAASRVTKKSKNDADRLKKYLDRFGLEWNDIPH
jgi:transcriptional regulatory protein RtcR